MLNRPATAVAVLAVAVAMAATVVCALDAPLAIPTTTGVLANPFSLTAANVQGVGASIVQSISITNGAGTAVFASLNGSTGYTETFDVAAYQYQNWAAYDLTLYDLIGVSRDSQLLTVMYIYETTSTGALSEVFYESFGLPDASDPQVTGTVSGSGSVPQHVNVKFSALTAPVPPRTPYTIAATGAQLTLNATYGVYTPDDASGVTYHVVPFASVDCTSCGDGGWYELHSLFLAPDPNTGTPNAIGCFGILYFEFDSANTVLLDYSLCLPSLTAWPPASISVPNGWTGGLGAAAHVPPVRLPRRMPRRMQQRA